MKIKINTLIIVVLITTFYLKVSTNGEKNKYTLEIDKVNYFTENNQRYLSMSVSLHNNTDSTLKYISMSSSPLSYYIFDSKSLRNDEIISVTHNLPYISILHPNEKSSIIFRFKIISEPIKLHLGLVLLIINDDNVFYDYIYGKYNKVTIWVDYSKKFAE